MTIAKQSRTAPAPTEPAAGREGLLDARPGGVADRFAAGLGERHPVLVFAAALVGGVLALFAVSIAVALFMVEVLASASGAGLGDTDESFVRTLAENRTETLNSVAEVGAGTGTVGLVSLTVLVAVAAVLTRHWRVAAFAAFALMVESATYYVTSAAVPRERPSVPRLEQLEPDTSYPSGHTAAAVAVYAGVVLLLTTRFTSGRAKALAWAAAILLISFVALSRMYQGMHHPLDVLGGALVGIGAICVAAFAARSAGAAAERRRDG